MVSRGRPPSPPVAHAGSLFRRSAFLGCRFFRCQWWLRCCSLNLLRMLSHTAIGVRVREQGLWDAVSALECHQSSLLWVSSCGLAVTLSQSLRMVLSSDYARRTPAVFSAHRPVARPRTSQAEAQAPQKLNFEKGRTNFLNSANLARNTELTPGPSCENPISSDDPMSLWRRRRHPRSVALPKRAPAAPE